MSRFRPPVLSLLTALVMVWSGMPGPAGAVPYDPRLAHPEHFHPDEAKAFPRASDPRTLDFSVPCDGQRVEGEVRFPADRKGRPRLVMVVPDAGPYDRAGASPLGPAEPLQPALARLLVERGFAVAIYDRRGTGNSSGDMNLPWSRHVEDAGAVHRFLNNLDRVRTDGVILAGVGAGCLAVGRIAADDPGPGVVAALLLFPPLPDFAAALRRLKPGGDPAVAALAQVIARPRAQCLPFLFESADPLAVYLTTNPLEIKELLASDVAADLAGTRCPALLVADVEPPAGLGQATRALRLDRAATDAVSLEIARFLEPFSR